MQEWLCLHGVGLDFCIRPMLRQAETIIINHMHIRIRQMQFIYQHLIATLVGVEFHLVIMLTQGAATQRP